MSRGKSILPYLLVVVLGVAAYVRGLETPFIFDDIPTIVRNPHLRHLWPLREAVKAEPGWPLAGRPVVAWTFALNYAWGGDRSMLGFHLFNLAIHLLCAILILDILKRTLITPPLAERFGNAATGLATAVAALWVIHPLNTEAVLYLVQRTELMVTLFYLLTLWCAMRSFGAWKPWAWMAAAIVASGLGMGCKEVMVSAPLMVLLYDRTLISGSFAAAFKRHKGLYVGLAATWLILGAILLTSPRGQSASATQSLTSLDYLRTQAKAIVWYLRLCFWPHPLSIIYPWPVLRTWGEALPWGLAVLALLGATAWALWKRMAVGLAGALFFMVLAPSSSVIPIVSELMAERRMYLPLAAVVTVVVLSAYAVLAKLAENGQEMLRRRLGPALVTALAAALAVGTAMRVEAYQSAVSIWSDAVAQYPHNSRALNNLGWALAEQGRNNDAIVQYAKAVAVAPDYIDAWVNLSNAYFRLGQYEQAIPRYLVALKLDANNDQARLNLANCYLDLNEFPQAKSQLDQLVVREPRNAAALTDLGIVMIKMGNLKDALPYLAKSVEIQPDSMEAQMNYAGALTAADKSVDALRHYGVVLQAEPGNLLAQLRVAQILLDQKHPAEAETHLRAVLKIDRHNSDALSLLGVSLTDQGKTRDAVNQFSALAKVKPQDADAHNNLALALGAQGRFEEAAKEFQKALDLDPNNPYRHLCMGMAYDKLGNLDDAMGQYEAAAKLDEKSVDARVYLGDLLLREHRPDEAIKQYRQALKMRPRWPPTLCGLTWALATKPHCTPEEAKEALKLIMPAVAMTRARQPQVLAAYAAAEARLGDYHTAVSAAEIAGNRAVAAGMGPLARRIQEQLGYYMAKKPFIDAPGAPGWNGPTRAASSPSSTGPANRASITQAPRRATPPASAAPAMPVQTAE